MKKIYMTFLFAGLFLFASAQNYEVTLVVDMSAVTPADTVCVAGNFQPSDAINTQSEWTAGVHILDDTDGDMIYNIIISVPGGDYQYKYINGGDWGDNEGAGLNADCGVDDGFGNFNRGMTISSDTVIAFIYDACTQADLSTNIFEVATTTATMEIAPNPATDFARVIIQNPENEALTMTVSNLMGQTISTNYDLSNNVAEINTSNLAPGIYLVSIENNEGGVATEKLVVR